jgi:hypothetical protein
VDVGIVIAMSASDVHEPAPDLVERMTDLEVRLAYQDRTLRALDEVIRELAGRVATLERDVRQLQPEPPSPTTVSASEL